MQNLLGKFFHQKLKPCSSAVAFTKQEGINGYREKAIRIASVERVGLDSFMELSVSGHVLKWAR